MNLPENFRRYLGWQKLSPVTVKNYVVDITHFLHWLKEKTNVDYRVAGEKIFGLFTQATLTEYKNNLKRKKTPFATINRRLSALRKFGQFGRSHGWLVQNPGQTVTNTAKPPNWLEAFQKHLKKEKVSPVTVKNYLSDIRQFFAWLECNPI